MTEDGRQIPLKSLDVKLENDDDECHNSKGISWFVAGLLVIGALAGGGVVVLPTALIQATPVLGIVIFMGMGIICTFSSCMLGKCWTMLTECWPQYKNYTRKPYAEIGLRAAGPKMRTLIGEVAIASQFMLSVVYLLLSAKDIKDAAEAFFDVHSSVCLVTLIVALALLPATFLKSPVDFWWVIVLAMLTTAGAIGLVAVGAAIDYDTCAPHRFYPDLKTSNMFMAFGSFIFAYGGHAGFPTIQHDMKTPGDFTKSSLLAFGITTVLYLITGVAGVLAYGDSLGSSVINSIQTVAIQQAINLLITIHLVLTFILTINPVNQEVEDWFKVPHHFCWQRVIVRTGVMAAIVFVGESVPNFGPLLHLVGGSTTTLSAIIFPCACFLFINARREKMALTGDDQGPVTNFKEMIHYNSRWMLVACIITIVVGTIGGGAATYSAIKQITYTKFEYPCYVSAFMDSSIAVGSLERSTNCCGHFQNLTVFDSVTCSAPNLNFYS